MQGTIPLLTMNNIYTCCGTISILTITYNIRFSPEVSLNTRPAAALIKQGKAIKLV
jgi:hypothetical protein